MLLTNSDLSASAPKRGRVLLRDSDLSLDPRERRKLSAEVRRNLRAVQSREYHKKMASLDRKLAEVRQAAARREKQRRQARDASAALALFLRADRPKKRKAVDSADASAALASLLGHRHERRKKKKRTHATTTTGGGRMTTRAMGLRKKRYAY